MIEGRDWDLLEATQDSLREHMAIAKDLKQKLEKCKEVLEFYGDNHLYQNADYEDTYVIYSTMEMDCGTKARTLLKELEG